MPNRIIRPKKSASTASTSKKPTSTNTDQLYIPGPDELVIPPDNLDDYFVLIYGASSMGKTLTCGGRPGALTCQFDPERRNNRIRQVSFQLRTVAELLDGAPDPCIQFQNVISRAADDESIKYIVVDNIKECYQTFENSYLKENNLLEVPKKDFGACRGQINAAFKSFFSNLKFAKRFGITFTAHMKEREGEIDTGTTENVFGPNTSKAVFDYLQESLDFAFFYSYQSKRRVMHVRWDSIWTKCGSGFKQPDGEPLKCFEMPSIDTDDPTTYPLLYERINDAFKGKVWDFNRDQEEIDNFNKKANSSTQVPKRRLVTKK